MINSSVINVLNESNLSENETENMNQIIQKVVER